MFIILLLLYHANMICQAEMNSIYSLYHAVSIPLQVLPFTYYLGSLFYVYLIYITKVRRFS